MEYKVGQDLINAKILFESKQTELQALAYLKKSGVNENQAQKVIERFRNVDSTKTMSLTMPMARAYLEVGDNGMTSILSTFREVSILVNNNKITLPQVDDAGFHTNNKTFKRYTDFQDFIENYQHFDKGLSEFKSDIVVKTEAEPIYPTNEAEAQTGFVVYDGNDVGRCIYYGMGGLTGKIYSFCIGSPGNTNWQSYRDNQGSTFYYVLDKKRDLDDPLHITVVDVHEDGQIVVFDEENRIGILNRYGEDYEAYLNDLAARGLPIGDLFVHKPKTPEEEDEKKKLGRKSESLQFFKDLTFKEKSKYIGRGHLLTDEQFSFLWEYRKNKGVEHLLNQYFNMGIALTPVQFKMLTGE